GIATAGVSAFGFGGTNAHVTLREYRPKRAETSTTAPAVLALDAPTPERLREDAADLVAWLESPAGQAAALPHVAYTLAGRLGKGRHRAVVVARSSDDASRALAKVAAGQPHPGVVTGSAGAS